MNKNEKNKLFFNTSATFADLCGLSPVRGLGLVSGQQAANYLGVELSDVRRMKERFRSQLWQLGVISYGTRELRNMVTGAHRAEGSDGLLLPLEDGTETLVPKGRATFFSASAVLALRRLSSSGLCKAPVHKQESSTAPKLDDRNEGTAKHMTLGGGTAGPNPMNKLDEFEDQRFGKIRVSINETGDPLFVAADVCKALDIEDTGRATSRLDEDELTRIKIVSGGQNREVIAVNEPGLYSLVLGSRKPEAKAFKRWITHEVIPSIRKHGAYMTPETLKKAILTPDFLIQLAQELKAEQEKNRALAATNQMLAGNMQVWEPRKVLVRLIRKYSSQVFGNHLQLGWADFHRELQYRVGINLNLRSGNGSLIDRLKSDEWSQAVAVAAALCVENGIDPATVVNQNNYARYIQAEVAHAD